MKSNLKVLPQQSSGSAKGIAGIVGKSSLTSEELKKLQEDIHLLTVKISQSSNQPTGPSSIVGELRGTVAENRSATESASSSRADMLDSILRKVTELNRLILKKTEPELIAGARPRRNSNTQDLYSIPTQFQVIDRLVDLHTQSKRSVVVHQHNTTVATAPASTEKNDEELRMLKSKNDAALVGLGDQLRKVEASLAEAELKNREAQNDAKNLKIENARLQSALDNMSRNPQAPVRTPEQATPPPVTINTEELDKMTKLYNDSMKTIRRLEERIECSASVEQKICNAILQLVKNITEDKPLGSVENYLKKTEVSASCFDCFGRLVSTAADRIDGFKLDIIALQTNAQCLENEISTTKLEKQMLSDDLTAVSVNYSSLRVAYSEMQTELIQQRVRLESKNEVNNEKFVKTLETKLALLAQSSDAEISRLTTALENKEAMFSEREREISNYNSHIAALEQELEDYRALTEKLKRKIREISPLDKRELLDSFEEVMRDEMMTMKGAFENKLKIARGELELLSKKHQQDIQTLKQSSIKRI